MRAAWRAAGAAVAIALGSCGTPPAPSPVPFFIGERVATALDAPAACRVSRDGVVWYDIAPGAFAPLRIAYLDCPQGGALGDAPFVALPRWAHAPAHTQTRFVAGTLQDEYSRAGTLTMEGLARANGVPMTWMIGNLRSWRDNGDVYLRGRAAGDDVEIEPYDDLLRAVRAKVPGFEPAVSIEGAGHERYIDAALRRGSRAIWGIAWNSNGVDATADRGTPWGLYCADPSSYKRPAQDGRCSLASIEWTARDLTRAYTTGHEEWYSTDPDDLQYRAGLAPGGAARYAEHVVDAYAAAGEFRPLAVIAQQESGSMGNAPGSRMILAAMYARAAADRMHLATLRSIVAEASGVGALPRAVAFPYIAAQAPFWHELEPVAPASIDYVDRDVAMTFAAPSTLPERIFDYAAERTSVYDKAVPQRDPFDAPALLAAAVDDTGLWLRVSSPRAQRFAFAVWSDASALGADPRATVRAGHAGFVVPVDLVQGISDVHIPGRRMILPLPLSD